MSIIGIHIHRHTHTGIYSWAHMQHRYTCVLSWAYWLLHTGTHLCGHPHPYAHTYIYEYMHTCTHTPVHISTHRHRHLYSHKHTRWLHFEQQIRAESWSDQWLPQQSLWGSTHQHSACWVHKTNRKCCWKTKRYQEMEALGKDRWSNNSNSFSERNNSSFPEECSEEFALSFPENSSV